MICFQKKIKILILFAFLLSSCVSLPGVNKDPSKKKPNKKIVDSEFSINDIGINIIDINSLSANEINEYNKKIRRNRF